MTTVRVLQQFHRCTRGASAVEFALVVPILIAVLFGIVTFGTYLGAVHGVQQLVAEATRASIGGLSSSERSRLAQASIDDNIAAYPFLSRDFLVVRTNQDSASNAFTVTITYDATRLPLFSFPLLPLPGTEITRSATIQRGGF